MKGPAYLAINPMGKVPTVVHEGNVISEAGAICAYIADAFPEAKLAPPVGDRRRAAYYRWLFFGAGPVEAVTSNTAFGLVVPEDKRGMVVDGCLADVEHMLEFAVSRSDYLAGDSFTAADVYLGSQIGWAMAFGTIEKRPSLERYVARIQARPAAERAKAIDDGLMAERKAREAAA